MPKDILPRKRTRANRPPPTTAEGDGVPDFYDRELHRKVAYCDMLRAVRGWLDAEYPDRVHPAGVAVDMIAVVVEEPSGCGVMAAAFHASPDRAAAHDCRTEKNSQKRKDCLYCKGDRKAVAL